MAKDATEAELEAALDAEVAAEQVDDSQPDVTAEIEQPKSGPLASALRSIGFEVDADTTEDEAATWVRENATAVERAQKAEERTRQLEAWYAAANQPKPDPAPAPKPAAVEATAPDKPKREVPEWDPDWEGVLKLDENGQVVPIASWVDPSIPGKYQKALKWQKAEQARLLRDPSALLRETGYEDELKSRLLTPHEERIAALEKRWEQQTQKQIVSERDQFLVDNAHFYAEVGEDGKPVRDAQGKLIPNANYQQFVEYEAELERDGMTDPAKRLKWAINAVPPTAPAAVAPTEPAPEPAVKRVAIRNRVNDRIRANGQKLAQPPVRTQRGGATEIVDRPASIGQLKNRWLGMLEQGVGGDE